MQKVPIPPFVLLKVLGVLNLVSDMEMMKSLHLCRWLLRLALLCKASVCAASTSVTHVQKSLLQQDVVVDLQQWPCSDHTEILRGMHSLRSHGAQSGGNWQPWESIGPGAMVGCLCLTCTSTPIDCCFWKYGGRCAYISPWFTLSLWLGSSSW